MMTLIRRPLVVLLLLITFSGLVIPGGLAVNVLSGADGMNPRDYLSISDQYYLVMQPDCTLFLYNRTGQPLRRTNKFDLTAIDDCRLFMQPDGNLVIYNYTQPGSDIRSAVWAQGFVNVFQGNHSFLLLGDQGTLAFYTNDGSLFDQPYTSLTTTEIPVNASGVYPSFFRNSSQFNPWTPSSSLQDYPYMPAGYFLTMGNRLLSSNWRFELALGSDCNLQSREISYLDGSKGPVLWESRTPRTEPQQCQLMLHQDGLLLIRDMNTNKVYWTSTKAGVEKNSSFTSWVLKVNPDNGNLSVSDITNSSTVLWTNTAEHVSSAMAPNPVTHAKITSRSIAWIVVGVISGASVLAMAVYFYSRNSFYDRTNHSFLRASGGALTKAKIKQATNNYANLIGRGGFGDVFYGKFSDGQEVAAKVLSANSHQSKHEFYNEIELLSKVHHKYLVALLGYSCTRKHQTLIYEYIGGGDLRHRLQEKGDASNPLSWRQRTRIILQVAEGLEYLHDKCSPPIIHRDVKSTNILLTKKLDAKVADFGLSKLKTHGQEDATHITTVVKGTPGYLDPEYHLSGMLTEKSDVYAFGIVLMEILTGLPVIGEHHMHIAQRVGDAWRQGQVDSVADPRLELELHTEELVSLVEVALWCCRRISAERPFMRQVVRRLHGLGLASCEPSLPQIDVGDESQALAIELTSSRFNLESSADETAPSTAPLSRSFTSGASV